MLDTGRLEVPARARAFSGTRIFGIGRTIRGFLGALERDPSTPRRARQHSAGNGALMRVAGVSPRTRGPALRGAPGT